MSPTPRPAPSWHVPPERISAYLEDRVDVPTAASIEAHVLSCGPCRDAVGAKSEPAITSSSWAALERRIDAELTAPVERLAVRIGIPRRDARLLAPTRGLRLSWLLAMTLSLVCAAWLARQSDQLDSTITRLFFLTLAPLAPLVAVVTALSSASEPAPDIARATSASRLRIGAVRAVSVMLASIGIGLTVSLMLPGDWIRGVVWLCPALALSALGALAAPRIQPAHAVGSLGGGWVSFVVLGSYLADDRLAAFRPGLQLVYLSLAAVVVIAMALRPMSLDFRRLS